MLLSQRCWGSLDFVEAGFSFHDVPSQFFQFIEGQESVYPIANAARSVFGNLPPLVKLAAAITLRKGTPAITNVLMTLGKKLWNPRVNEQVLGKICGNWHARLPVSLGFLVSALPLLVLFGGCNLTSSRENHQMIEAEKKSPPMQTDSINSPTPIAGPIKYVALGDSTGAGVGAREGGYVARLFKRIVGRKQGSNLTNLCVSGATTSDVLRNQLKRALAESPNLVTLGIGINDIGHGFSVEQFSKNYEEILSQLRSGTKATIVVTNIPDISTAPRIPEIVRPEYQRLIIEFNRKLEEIASRHGVIVFDVYTITRDELPAHPEFFSADGFHPSDSGYELWAEKMWPTIARAIGEKSS